jgi:hypothetical protein
MEREAEWKLVYFEGRLESYFPDGSIIEKTKNSLTYYSTMGNKVTIGPDAIKHSKDLAQKLAIVATRLSVLEDSYYTAAPVDVESNAQASHNTFFKKYKIE